MCTFPRLSGTKVISFFSFLQGSSVRTVRGDKSHQSKGQADRSERQAESAQRGSLTRRSSPWPEALIFTRKLHTVIRSEQK